MAAGASGSGAGAGSGPELTAFQMEVARLFFALPESKGFLLAGGAALLAQHLAARSIGLPELESHSVAVLAAKPPREPGRDDEVLGRKLDD
jgi:hypothetical protein